MKSSDVKPELSPEDVLKRQKKLKQMSDAREKKRLKREELKKVSFQDQELQEKKSEYVPKNQNLFLNMSLIQILNQKNLQQNADLLSENSPRQ